MDIVQCESRDAAIEALKAYETQFKESGLTPVDLMLMSSTKVVFLEVTDDETMMGQALMGAVISKNESDLITRARLRMQSRFYRQPFEGKIFTY